MVSATNTTFDPLLNCAGAADFTPLNDLSALSPAQQDALESELGVDYCFVQSTDRMTMAWRAAISAAGAKILEIRREDGLSVSVPESLGCAGLKLAVDGTRASCSWKPAHVPAWELLPMLAGTIPPYLLWDDGSLILEAVVHRGEDPRSYEPLVALGFACVEVLDSTVPSEPADTRFMTVRIPADAPNMDLCAQAVATWLCRLEAVEAVFPAFQSHTMLDESVWYTQTSIAPAIGAPKYDGTAKLFENGVTGRGQVVAIADTGLDTDDCHFRYGPNLTDVTPAVISFGYIPPLAANASLPDPNWRPDNKVVAYYYVPSTLQLAYTATHHGTKVAGCALGDTYSFLAARAGVERDDPHDDERPPGSANPDPFGTLVNHHQIADGAAPGAQLIVQEIAPTGPPGSVADLLRQAYDTEPGARAWNCSGACSGNGGSFWYTYTARDLDRAAYQLRDLLPTLPSGNDGPGYASSGSFYYFDDAAAAKNVVGVGATKHADDGPGGLAIGMMASLGSPGPVGLGDSGESSHGPGFPNRIKPDVVVPGEDLTVPDSSVAIENGSGNGDSSCLTAVDSGTSGAAPQVAGLAVNLRQYFVDGYYPGGAPSLNSSFVPTSALLKAVLINSTRNLKDGVATGDAGQAPGDRPTFGQGWGKVVADDTLYFAGDPTNPPAERARLLVLNDVPNGLTSTASINDDRGAIVDDFKAAINDGEVHEFAFIVKEPGDLHVTLVWSDVEGNPASATDPWDPTYTGGFPLQNDLDLELIAPDGSVWRPRPGGVPVRDPLGVLMGVTSEGDPERLWANGYSIPGATPCPPGCGATCPDVAPPGQQMENQHEQDAAALCDFRGRDRENNVENVFMGSAAPGGYRIRVIGYEVHGNGRPCVAPDGSDCDDASPNFVGTDPLDTHDVIGDIHQGYALIASGPVIPTAGHLSFDRASYECADDPQTPESEGMAIIRLKRWDAPPLTDLVITVRTEAGDCDVFPLETDVLYEYHTQPIPIRALVQPAIHLGCDGDPDADGYPGDGVVHVLDDGWIIAQVDVPLSPSGTRRVEAGATARCRNVTPTGTVISDPCAGSTSNGLLNPNELASIRVDVASVGIVGVSGLMGELVPADDRVSVVPTRAVMMQDDLDPLNPLAPAPPSGSFNLFVDAALGGPGCYTPLQFRLELTGEDGFRDAVNFEVALDCSVVGTGMPTRPGEVDPGSLRVVKDPVLQTELVVSWGPAADATAYNLWQGQVQVLRRGAYDHVIPDDMAPGSRNPTYCEVPGLLTSTLVLAALPRGYDHALYFLATAEAPCSPGLGSIDGPFGHADTVANLPPEPDVAELPAGRRLDGGCR